jgi:hypothetical protein
MELKDIPDLTEKAESVKKNWWVYALVAIISICTHFVDGYLPAQDLKQQVSINTQLTRKLDSTNRSNALYNQAQEKILLDEILKKNK